MKICISLSKKFILIGKWVTIGYYELQCKDKITI